MTSLVFIAFGCLMLLCVCILKAASMDRIHEDQFTQRPDGQGANRPSGTSQFGERAADPLSGEE